MAKAHKDPDFADAVRDPAAWDKGQYLGSSKSDALATIAKRHDNGNAMHRHWMVTKE